MSGSSPRIPPAFEALIEQSLVGVYVIQHDRVIYANPRLAELFGYTLDELLALPTALYTQKRQRQKA